MNDLKMKKSNQSNTVFLFFFDYIILQYSTVQVTSVVIVICHENGQ